MTVFSRSSHASNAAGLSGGRAPSPPGLSEWLAAPPDAAQAKRPTPWWAMIASALLGGALSYVVITMALDAELLRALVAMPPLQAAGFAAVALVLVWLALLAHEAGHLWGGVWGDLRPVLLLGGPLRLSFEGRAMRVGYNPELSTWGGLAVAVPQGEEVGRRAVALMVAGGPCASLLLALTAWWMPADGVMVRGWWSFLALISGAIAVGTLLPMSLGGYVSDGRQLLQVWRGSPDSVHRLQLAALMGQAMAGLRPGQWPVRTLQTVVEHAQDPILRTSALLMWAQGEDDAHATPIINDQHPALRAFEALALDLHHGGLAHYPTAFRPALCLPVATFLGQRVGDAAAAGAWLKAAEGGIAEPWERLHANAALAWAEGDPLKARALADQALQALGGQRVDGTRAMARDRLRMLRP